MTERNPCGMKIIDKRIGKWLVVIENKKCPDLTYPRNDIACSYLEHKNPTPEDTYCYKENCPFLALIHRSENLK